MPDFGNTQFSRIKWKCSIILLEIWSSPEIKMEMDFFIWRWLPIIVLENFQAAADSLKSWMEKEERMGEIDAFHKAAFHYINIKASGCDTDVGENALTQIYGEEVMKQVSQIFGDPEKIIEKLYPKFDCPDCEHCNNYSNLCKQAEYTEIIKNYGGDKRVSDWIRESLQHI